MSNVRNAARRASLHLNSKGDSTLASLQSEIQSLIASASSGTLSPDVQASPSVCPLLNATPAAPQLLQIGRYLLQDVVTTSPDPASGVKPYRAIHIDSQMQRICKVSPISKYLSMLAPYFKVGFHANVNNIEEIIVGAENAYMFFPRDFGDLHSYVRGKRRLNESEARALFRQILSAVRYCHSRGVLIRDVKLRKFIFRDQNRTQLMLDGLEDAVILPHFNDLGCSADTHSPPVLEDVWDDDDVDHSDEYDDSLTDKHGCPAYVSPEILNYHPTEGSDKRGYSGRAAASWSLGVLLYTMLLGRYPFHDSDPAGLFAKIRRGRYAIPASDNLSFKARCLLRGLLRTDPLERLTLAEVARHPWMREDEPQLYLSQAQKLNTPMDIADELPSVLPSGADNPLSLTGSDSFTMISSTLLSSSQSGSTKTTKKVANEQDQSVPEVGLVASRDDSLIFS